METDIARRVKGVLAEQLNLKPEDLRDDATLADFNADSLTRIEIVLRIEDEFKIDIPKDDVTGFADVKSAIALVETLVKQKSA